MRLIVTALLLAAACGEPADTDSTDVSDLTDDGVPADCNTENEACEPGTCRGEGSRMLPGSDCLSCHEPGEHEGWYAAGTIFADKAGLEPAEGVTIRITGADGVTTQLTSNSVGNFFTGRTINFPATVEVERDGEIRQMGSEIHTGACNSCHACDGAAQGKMFAP